ncbi:MAG: NADH-quinone oxidoreductase subunit N [Planctomycetes bacterium]|nr:NADH-quinone oxidoreductase subunit N [Planctomycetota bacterium]
MSAWLHLFTLELAVVAIALLVLLWDAFAPAAGRAVGWTTALLLGGVFAASFFVDGRGTVPHGVFVRDEWVVFHERLFLAAGILGVLGSIDWLATRTPKRQAEYYALLLFSLAGMMLLAGARDWILLVTCFELMSMPLYVLCAYGKQDGPASEPKLAAEAGLKLFITGAASSGLTLFGLALVVGMTGTTHVGGIGANPAPLTIVGMLFVLAGFGFKVGAVPFHMWVPDTYQGAPTPFVAFLSVAPKAAGLATLAIVLLGGWSADSSVWLPVLLVLAGASMVVGNLFALPQTDARRLLGFSGVAQIGYALLALGAMSRGGLAMTLFFVATYVFTNLGVFFVLHAAAEEGGGHSLARIAGLSRRSPWLGGALLVFLLSLAGIPFVAGFWAKLFVFMEAWNAGLVGLVVLGVALAVIGLYYYLTVARSTYMADGDRTTPVPTGFALRAAILVCLIFVVGLGLWPRPLVEAADRAAAGIVSGR